MNRYRTTPRAERDLVEHYAYIARDKIAPADRFLKTAEQSFERLAEMPGAGRAWESETPQLQGVRVYPMAPPYRNYLVFYRIVEDQAIEILAILHAARDVGAILEDILRDTAG
jgi:plasmid stabilization system protein ParE